MWSVFFALLLSSISVASAQIENVRASISGTPDEPAVALNPLDPLNIIAGANLDFVYTSTDGGYHWQESHITSSFASSGDPSITFDNAGNAYYCHIGGKKGDGTRM